MLFSNKKTEEFYKKIVSEYDELSNDDRKFYALVLDAIYQATNKQYTVDQVFRIYDFFTDVADGEMPDIDLFDKGDSFKGFYRLSKIHPLTKDLSEEERLLLCFCIYDAHCIRVFNEKTQESDFDRKLFEGGLDCIKKEFEYEKERFPQKFKIMVISDPSKDDYGYTPLNPIEVLSVALEYRFLRSITYQGKKITFERGPTRALRSILIDSFDIFVNGDKVTTLYLTSEGSYNTITCPKGFEFIK